MFSEKIYSMSQKNFAEITKIIHNELKKTKATEKEILQADLLLEENFMRIVEIGSIDTVSVKIIKRFGEIILKIEYEGEEFNPLVEMTDYNENETNRYRMIILKANREKLNFLRKNKKNIVLIQVNDSSAKQFYFTIIALVAGISFGFILKFLDVPETVLFINGKMSETVTTLFMHAINMMIVPMIFFSIVSGITEMANAADAGKYGIKIIGLYTLTTAIASLFTIFFAMLLFSNGVPQVSPTELQGISPQTEVSIFSMIENIIPQNLINPILNTNMLQAIFVSVFFGFTINKLGDKVKLLQDFIKISNLLCMEILKIISKFIPIIVFFAMAGLILNVGSDSIFVLGKLLFGEVIATLIMVFMIYPIFIKLVGKISPLPFLKKILSFLMIPFSTSSSNITIPFSIKFCEEKMGVSPKLSSFSIPIGATVNMDGSAIFLGLSCTMILKMYNVDLDINLIFTLFFAIFTMTVGIPGIPGGGSITIGIILTVFGLPMEAMTIVFGIAPIIERIATCNNVAGDIAMTTSVAGNENILDKKIYNS